MKIVKVNVKDITIVAIIFILRETLIYLINNKRNDKYKRHCKISDQVH
jgi:uncharacterized membrane protein (DUF373 family)